MTDYELIAPASREKPGKARPVRTYKLTPGMAWLYNEGDLHSPRRRAPTQLSRIEGINMDKIKRLRYETDINLRRIFFSLISPQAGIGLLTQPLYLVHVNT